MLFSQVFICSVITFTLTAAQTKEDEGRPYEFGFTIDGEQHRHEKKDENGIIQGEFGFITADGIYHVTVYATDENGDFKILSMRNVRISAPLDGSPGPGPVSSQPVGPNAKVQPNLLQAEPKPLPPIQSAPPSLVPSTTPVVFTTRPTIKPGCAGCGVVHKTATLAPLPFQVAQQNAALNKQSNVGPSSQFSPNENNQYQNNPYGPNSSVGPNYSDGQNNFNQNSASVGSSYPGGPNSFNQNSATGSNYPGGQNNFNQNSPSVGTNYPGGQNQYPEGQNQFNSPGNYPGGQNQYNQGGQNAPVNPNYPQTQNQFNSPGNSNYPGEPAKPGNENNVNYNGVSNDLGNKPNAVPPGFNQPPNPKPNPLQIPKLPPVSVDDNVIHVQGERPQNIPIRDKYPGMVNGLPEGIDEGDIKDLLYKFHYTVGFHGHYEKGLKNGAKVGGYFVNGRDGVSRVVTYVADENGYRPKFKFIRLGLDSDETPKEGSEKTFGLKSFEFVWYPVN